MDTYIPQPVGWSSRLCVFSRAFHSKLLLCLKRFSQKKPDDPAGVKKAKNVLMTLQGFGFACWFFDVLSTTLIINVKQSGTELNPLGWPYSAFGALAFYVPMVFAANFLLFRVKSKESFYATVAVTVLTMFMGALNFGGSLSNFPKIYSFAASAQDFWVLGIWLAVTATLSALNTLSMARARKLVCVGPELEPQWVN